MARSYGFGSAPSDYTPFRTRFRYGSTCRLNLAAKDNSPARDAKSTQSGIPQRPCDPQGIALPQLVGTRFQVLFHSPHRGSFHLSLTVLSAIGRRVVFSLRRWSSQIPTGLPESRGTRVPHPGSSVAFRLRGCHPLWQAFPDLSARRRVCNSPKGRCTPPVRPHYPH